MKRRRIDRQRVAIARHCLDAAFNRTMSFPDIVWALTRAGFESYAVDFRRNTTTYFLPDGDNVVLESRHPDGMVAANFDQAGVATQIQWAQANPPDYSYTAFCQSVKAMGCAGYLVSLPRRRVLCFGRAAETHLEHLP